MKKLKLFRSYISSRAIWNVTSLLIRSNYGAFIGEGPEVKAFEDEFAQRFGLKNVAMLNSGTSALELAYELAGIGPGDEVITPVFTCTATNIPLVRRGATIVFADTEPDLNINVEDVECKITPRTKAIVFVHFGGHNRGLKELLEICEKKKIILIEDAAQAVVSPFWGKADFTCLSFQAIKTLTTGDGGAIICKRNDLHAQAKKLRWFGYNREEKQRLEDTDLAHAGYKYHMSDITAAIGRGNLRSFDKLKTHQYRLIEEYKKYGVTAFPWFAMVLSDRRDELRSFLKTHGVASGMYHYRNDTYSLFGGRRAPGTFPVMDKIESKYLLLPLHIGISVSDARYICSLLEQFKTQHTA
jgi:perosamine synthetase